MNPILLVEGADATNNIAFAILPTGPGVYTIPGPLSQAGNNALLTVTSGGSAVGTWAADFGKGSGTITVSTLTATAATGTFSFTLNANQGTGATGTKVVTGGAFSVTF